MTVADSYWAFLIMGETWFNNFPCVNSFTPEILDANTIIVSIFQIRKQRDCITSRSLHGSQVFSSSISSHILYR